MYKHWVVEGWGFSRNTPLRRAILQVGFVLRYERRGDRRLSSVHIVKVLCYPVCYSASGEDEQMAESQEPCQTQAVARVETRCDGRALPWHDVLLVTSIGEPAALRRTAAFGHHEVSDWLTFCDLIGP